MGRDSFIHPTLKRPPRRSREMSTWRGRLREISIPFPSLKRKENTPPPLPQHSLRPAPIDAGRQVEKRGREEGRDRGRMLYAPHSFSSLAHAGCGFFAGSASALQQYR